MKQLDKAASTPERNVLAVSSLPSKKQERNFYAPGSMVQRRQESFTSYKGEEGANGAMFLFLE